MMALALKKKKEDEARQAAGAPVDRATSSEGSVEVKEEPVDGDGDDDLAVLALSDKLDGLADGADASGISSDSGEGGAERGRRIDKGKAKVSIVGFDGTNQDDAEEEE
jgi:GATA-binding protein